MPFKVNDAGPLGRKKKESRKQQWRPNYLDALKQSLDRIQAKITLKQTELERIPSDGMPRQRILEERRLNELLQEENQLVGKIQTVENPHTNEGGRQ